jgi:hypothetical protein
MEHEGNDHLFSILGIRLDRHGSGYWAVFCGCGKYRDNSGSGHVSANHPRPLFQTVEAVIREYGWVVDYEDPPYFSTFDLTDDTDPRWRASHPNSKGVVRVVGSAFQSTFPEPVGETTREQVLKKIISDYNLSGNPGKFALRKEGENRYAVMGVAVKDDTGKDKDAPVLLDTLMTVPEAHRSAFDTLNLVLNTLSTTSGVNVHASMLSTNGIGDPDIVVGGKGVPARTLLLQTLSAAHKHRTIRWELRYSPDRPEYFPLIYPVFEVSLSGGKAY